MIGFKKDDLSTIGKNFIPKEFIPDLCDEYYLRDFYTTEKRKYREVTLEEKEILISNKNIVFDWSLFLVEDGFNPNLVRNNIFYGLVRIGKLNNLFLEYHNLRLPVGIYNSTIYSCDFGDDVSIDNVFYLSHYIISKNVIISNIQEMLVSDTAKFGNGIIKIGEDESKRIKVELGNENGHRDILAFDGILGADCYLWYKNRDDKQLLETFKTWTENKFDKRRGYYGFVGENCVIKNSRSIKDVIIKAHTYIKGANKLKNLTINSREDSPSQIGEGVELTNGIIGYGCRIFYGVKAVRFILGDHSQLKYGARLINSFLGENSTISCCEVLNSLIFPFHEQHHNNSFLIAGTILGQSNIAAGATIGSNHNSRAADGEIFAARGFWPGLCTNFKHYSKFASFCIVEKGSYKYEMNVEFPFALVSNDLVTDSLQIAPAFYLMYNMYALSRNPIKFADRDKRKHKYLNIELDYFAPDTINEVFTAIELIQFAVGSSFNKISNKVETSRANIIACGKELLDSQLQMGFPVYLTNVENSKRKVVLLKAKKSYQEYLDLIVYYSVKTMVTYFEKNGLTLEDGLKKFANVGRSEWVNLGGQLMEKGEFVALRDKIKSNKIDSWDSLHSYYKESASQYDLKKCQHAISSILELEKIEIDELASKMKSIYIQKAREYSQNIYTRTLENRQKDFNNSFRTLTFDTVAERDAVLGQVENDLSICKCKEQQLEFQKKLELFV